MEQPKEMNIVHLEVLLMPNGELLCFGKHIGWFKDFRTYLHPEKEPTNV